MRLIVSFLLLFAPLVLSQTTCTDIYPHTLCQGILENRFISSFRGCQYWIQCINANVANCGICSGFLHFDPDTQTCTYPDFANCDIYAANVTCTVGQVSREPHPANCNLYFLCTGDVTPIQMSCANDLHFDPVLRKCNFPHLANCEPAAPPPGPPGVSCPDSGGVTLIPDPTSCDHFYICDFNQYPHRHACPPNYHFCQDFRFCRPIGQAVCTPPTPLEVFGVHSLSDFECPYSGIHFLPYSGDCSRYVLCIDGSAHEQRCAPDLYFNPTTQRCEPQDNFTCPY
ncbi:peritrophin-1-like [Phlebotomus papatasi]|uniref:peritrophin-1-like n=1 Tax=Phlebotomus papatasi TaxID=29031 RepID=UPI0024846DD3|nr:peritrophin-1-like [Phlebotomus papatasi]